MVGALVVTAIISPIVAMGIGETREAILGLAPEESVLQLADKIDTSRVENETKLAELQSTIDEQQIKLTEQQKMIDEFKVQTNATATAIATSVSAINKEAECRKLYVDNSYCSTSAHFKTKAAFDKYLKERGETYEKGKETCEEMSELRGKSYDCDSDKPEYDVYNAKFKKCQEIIAKCS